MCKCITKKEQIYYSPKYKRFRFFKRAFDRQMVYRGNLYIRVGKL